MYTYIIRGEVMKMWSDEGSYITLMDGNGTGTVGGIHFVSFQGLGELKV